MPTESPVAKKLKALRKRVPKLSIRRFAKEMGYPSHTSYAYYEDDFKEDLLPMEIAMKVATALVGRGEPPVTEAEILALAGLQQPPARYGGFNDNRIHPPSVGAMPVDVPVMGTAVGGSSGDFELNGQVVDYVRRPPGISGNRSAYCLYLRGTSMQPWAEESDLLYVDPNRPPKSGDHVLIEMKSSRDGEPGAAYVKRLVAVTPTKYRLAQYNPPNDKIELDRNLVLHFHRIMKLGELLGI